MVFKQNFARSPWFTPGVVENSLTTYKKKGKINRNKLQWKDIYVECLSIERGSLCRIILPNNDASDFFEPFW